MKICVWKLLSGGRISRRSMGFEDVEKLETFYESAMKNLSDPERYGYFEQISGPQRLYMDIDVPIKSGVASDAWWKDNLLLQCRYIEEHIGTVSSHKPKILVFDQSTKVKYSSHILVENFYVQDHVMALRFHNSCKLVDGVDENVYHSSQLLRMWKSYKASNSSARKEVAFRFFSGQEQEVNNIRLADTLVSNLNSSSYIYNNREESKPRKRNPRNCKSNTKNEIFVLNLVKAINMSSTNHYHQLKASGLSFGEPLPLEDSERKFGDMIPILYDGEPPVIIVGTKIKGQMSTLFRDNFGKKRLVLSLDINSPAAKSYNTICDFVSKRIKSGSLDSVVEGIKSMHAEVNRIKPLTGEKTEKLFLPVTGGTNFSDMDGFEIEPIESFPLSINGVVGMRVNGVFVGPKSVKISLTADIVMVNPKQRNQRIANLARDLDNLAM